MTSYTKTMTEALAEVRSLQEDNMDLMRKAAGGAMQTIKMKDGKLKMDSFTASAIMKVFDKVNPVNQKKMAQMINQGTKGGMMKLQDFVMKQVKSGYGEEFDLDEGREKSGRQLIDPKREVMVVKKNKVVVIDKKDEDKYLKQGWELAEQNEAYELGTDEYREYLEKLTPGEMDEASARADAKRAMRKGREVDPADVDTDATDDDVKGASKNIIMQMRKAVSLRGNFPVEFGDGKKVKIPAKVGQAVQDKYNSLKKPADKEKFQSQVAKSYKDMLKVLKAGYMMKAAYEEVELDEKRDMSAPPVSAKVVEDEGFRLVMKFKDGTTEALPALGKPSMQNLKGIVDKNILKNPRRKAWVPVVSAAMKKGPVKEETELDEDKLPDMRDALMQVRAEKPVDLSEHKGDKPHKHPHPPVDEASGDKEAYQKFFNAALKKFKVDSPADFKSDEEKKKFYDYIDKNWEGDDEKAEQVKEFKIQSMKDALAQIWGMEEGKNPFAEHKGTKPHKHPHEEDQDEENEKRTKTETGKKPAAIDLKPKIADK